MAHLAGKNKIGGRNKHVMYKCIYERKGANNLRVALSASRQGKNP